MNTWFADYGLYCASLAVLGLIMLVLMNYLYRAWPWLVVLLVGSHVRTSEAAVATANFYMCNGSACSTVVNVRENLWVDNVWITSVIRASTLVAGECRSWQSSWNEDVGHTYYHTITIDPQPATHAWGVAGPLYGQGPFYIRLNCGTNGCVATNYTWTFNLTNNSPVPVRYQAFDDGDILCGGLVTAAGGGGVGTWASLDPGQGLRMTFSTPVGCGFGTTNVYVQSLAPGTWAISTCENVDGSSGTYTHSTGGYKDPPIYGDWQFTPPGGGGGGTGGGTTPPIIDPPSYYDPTNGFPINFGTNTDQAGFSALYDAISKGFAGTIGAVNTMSTDIQNKQTTQIAQLSALTNYVLGVSNAVVVARIAITNSTYAVSNVIHRSLLEQTNWLAGISNRNVVIASAITNVMGTNIAIGSAGTNLLTSMTNLLHGVSNMIGYGTSTNGIVGNTLSNLLMGLSNAVVASSGTNGSGTNVFDDSGITNAIWGAHQSLTNLYGEYSTNVFDAALIPSEATNASAAQSIIDVATEATTFLADYESAVLGTDPGTAPGGGGAPALFTISFMGENLNLDPAVRFPGIGTWSVGLWTLVLVLAFCYDASKAFFAATQTYAAAQTGGVPDLNGSVLGFGGNVAGLAVAVGIPFALIAIWVVVFQGIFGHILSTMGLANGIADISPVSAGAWYLLNLLFPVSLAVSLLWTRITLYFTMGKLVFVGASASRFLFGK